MGGQTGLRRGIDGPAGEGTYRGYDRAVSLGVYQGQLAHLIRQLKFDGRSDLGWPLGNLLAWPVQARLGPAAEDRGPWRPAVVPVPLHPDRRRERGYNQAALVAAGLAAGLGLRVHSNILTRIKGGMPQANLDRLARLNALEGAFAPARRYRSGASARPRLAGSDVLLVDDVLTTGATLDACASVLKSLGARRVFGCTVAVGLPRRLWRGRLPGGFDSRPAKSARTYV